MMFQHLNWDSYRNFKGELHLRAIAQDIGLGDIAKSYLTEIEMNFPISSRQVATVALITARWLEALYPEPK